VDEGPRALAYVLLEYLAAAEHEDDDDRGEVLAEYYRGDDGDCGEEVGAEDSAEEGLDCAVGDEGGAEHRPG